MRRSYCIGIDVGGTFTDAVLTDGDSIFRAKALTTPQSLGGGVLAACELVAGNAGTTLERLLPDVGRFGLGTTAVTNTLASRTGRRVGLITTQGFEDLIPMSLGRWVNEDGWLVKPFQIVDRTCIAGVRERVDRNGDVVEALDPDEVVIAARRLIDEEHVEAITVSFLWSCANALHEQQAVAVLKTAFPELPLTSGSSLLPVLREYERTTFALLNAYTSGALRGIDSLAVELRQQGLSVPLLLVHSGGGSITADEARSVPILLAESGPAAGVAASATVSMACGVSDTVTLDMGGTTLDLSVVSGGQPSRRSRRDVMGVWTALSSVDVESVGAGGGSIAWVDALGALRVGPRSAGADPGPACYGRGGLEPTVTDALVVLGYLDPEHFLGGRMSLDVEAARAACGRVGAQLGMDAEEVAWGIREVTVAEMVTAVRARLAERGLDPRSYAILSYGGCGGLFAGTVAQEIDSPLVLVPELASVLSAFGAANADIRRERIRSVGVELSAAGDVLAAVGDELRAEVDRDLANDGIDPVDRSIDFEAEMRIRRQKWELAIPVTAFGSQGIADLKDTFEREYVKRYGRGAFMTGAPIEIVVLRAIGTGRTLKASFNGSASTTPVTQAAPLREPRVIRVDRGGKSQTCKVALWSDLAPGHRIDGPALIDSVDTTVWVPSGARVSVDNLRNLSMDLRS